MVRVARGILIVVLLVLVALAGAWLYLRRSLPRVRGTLEVAGLHNSVDIVRDAHAVPHIYASNQEDAVFALGYVHAQDRLWQMDFQRRVGAGRLSEVLGATTIGTDRFLRTLGVYRAAEASLSHMSARTRALIDAYVAGVNAYLDGHRGPWPPEYVILGVRPEPFTAADVVVWAKMMSWDLSGNYDTELLRARLLATVQPADPVAFLHALWPGYPDGAPIVLPDFRGLYDGLDLAGLAAASLPPAPEGSGSNDWVLAGALTATGWPILANDPHLDLGAPSLWYLAHLSAPGLDVIGATLPGTPAVLLGHNDRIAWGFTNTGPDTQDTFVERVDPNDPSRYLTPDGSEPFETRREVIHVKGGDDLVFTARATRHGPVLSDVSTTAADAAAPSTTAEAGAPAASGDRVLALRWTALDEDDITLQAVLNLDVARDWDGFVGALRDFATPEQNIVYADVDGNVGYYAPARIPIRAAGDGSVPVPGWTGAYDWTGYVPFDRLPHAYDPADGRIVTANNRIVPDDYPYYLTRDWSEPYRVERITALLDAEGPATLDGMARIQRDQTSLFAQTFLPWLLAVAPRDDLERSALDAVRGWNGDTGSDLVAPLVFEAWYRALVRRVAADELGDAFDAFNGFRPLFLEHVLKDDPSWCDDVRTPGVEGCDVQAAAALTDAVRDLAERYGDDVRRWTWGRAHRARSDHNVFGATPLGRVFNLSIPNGGDAFTVDAARFDVGSDAAPFTQTTGPGYRAIYDLQDLDRSRFIQTTGQSGNVLSGHYRDFLTRWRDVAYLPMSTSRADAERGAVGTLVLRPPP